MSGQNWLTQVLSVCQVISGKFRLFRIVQFISG
jgi:hypothetical protein